MSQQILKDFKFEANVNTTSEYFNFEIKTFENLLQTKSENYWQKLGEDQALTLFHLAAERVPAYKHFLKRNHVKAKQIRNIQDFGFVPTTDKNNYVTAYSLEDRSWDGNLSKSKLIAISSGTSGEPKFWSRGGYQEFEAAIVHELIYRKSFQIEKFKTLIVIGFPMGVYVSGMATVLPSWLIAQKGYDLSVVSVGNNKSDMLKIVRQLGKQYQQIVLIGHPFFIKDVLETGKREGLNWHNLQIRIMLCSEGFNERWRDYIAKIIGAHPEHIVSVYGSSELLLMAYETRRSILLRRQLSENYKILEKKFSTNILPNIFQYNPMLRYIESINKELVFTSFSGLPLIRFNLHDQGVVFKEDNQTKSKSDWRLPFVALWGRSDQTLVFYAANIYPEHIQAALQNPSLIEKLTGKFVMRKGELKNLDEFLEINIELNNKVKPTTALVKILQKLIVEKLSDINMEYHFLQQHLEKDLVPRINLWRYQSEKYFKPGLKPKYISRQ